MGICEFSKSGCRWRFRMLSKTASPAKSQKRSSLCGFLHMENSWDHNRCRPNANSQKPVLDTSGCKHFKRHAIVTVARLYLVVRLLMQHFNSTENSEEPKKAPELIRGDLGGHCANDGAAAGAAWPVRLRPAPSWKVPALPWLNSDC